MLFALCGNFQGCANQTTENKNTTEPTEIAEEASWPMSGNASLQQNILEDNYRTYYEIFLYSFYDSDGDGIGDIQGLIEKLDYINDGDATTTTDLGFNGIWLMPIMPAASYHKYDVTNYEAIDPQYGTMEDFEQLIAECKKRGIRVIIDLVLNHTSSSHPWFTEACDYLNQLKDQESNIQGFLPTDYYHFSREKQSGYYPVPGNDNWYYEAGFWSEMPDLNLENQRVRTEISEITQFWIDKGVDGFRLDAVKEFESGSDSANIEILSWFMNMVQAQKEDIYVVGEMWSDLSAYAPYYGSGITSLFDFAFADSGGIIANVVKGITPASGYGKALVKVQESFESYSSSYMDAPFYTNHDMGRSAGYYAGDTSEDQTKLAGALNLLMSGSAFVYYGEELGMKGSGKDENKRAPMYWSKDDSTTGMCDGPSDMDVVNMKYDSLEEQQQAEDSIYNYYKNAILLRNAYPEMARGKVAFIEELSNDAVCVLTKEYQEEKLTIIINASDTQQMVDCNRLQELTGSCQEIAGALYTGKEQTKYQEDLLTIPPYGIILLNSTDTGN